MPSLNRRPLDRLCLALRKMEDEYVAKLVADRRAIGDRVPVGGAHMDAFFRSEGLRVTASRCRTATLAEAIKAGQEQMTVCVMRWNRGREWQVHRSEQHDHDWLEMTVLALAREHKCHH